MSVGGESKGVGKCEGAGRGDGRGGEGREKCCIQDRVTKWRKHKAYMSTAISRK